MKFEDKLLKKYPYLRGSDKLYDLVYMGIEFAHLSKELGSLSFAITKWRHMGNRTDEDFLRLADSHFNHPNKGEE